MVDGPISKIISDPMGALKSFGRGITEGTGKDIKALSQSEKRQFARYIKSLPSQAAQKKAMESYAAINTMAGRNRYVRKMIKTFNPATTKTVKKMGGQQKEGALARGGAVKKKMAYGGKATTKKKMMGGGKVMPKKKMMYGGKAKKK